MRKVLSIMMAVMAAAGVTLTIADAPDPAQAKDTMASHYGGLRGHCIGTRIEVHKIRNRRGHVVGRTELWYSPINGGENCVMTYNRAGSPWTRAEIWRLKHKGGLADAWAGDEGFYGYYAGGSYVDHANGRCVNWGGTVGDFGWFSNADGVHCG